MRNRLALDLDWSLGLFYLCARVLNTTDNAHILANFEFGIISHCFLTAQHNFLNENLCKWATVLNHTGDADVFWSCSHVGGFDVTHIKMFQVEHTI